MQNNYEKMWLKKSKCFHEGQRKDRLQINTDEVRKMNKLDFM